IVLAQRRLKVDVFEAEPQPGGAVRTLELTLPGFFHDFGSAVYPFAAGSPFFSSLPLSNHGLEWIHSPCPLAHPLDDGTAITLERDVRDAESSLGQDGRAWRRLIGPFAERWSDLSSEVLRPIRLFSRHPLLLARFFFFSSRRRHTSWPRDRSSDVCSSDLRSPTTSGVRRLDFDAKISTAGRIPCAAT